MTFELLNDASHLTPEISTAIRQQRLKQGATDRADFSLWFEKAADAKETYLAKLRDKTVGRLVLGSGETKDMGVILDLSLDAPHRGRRFGQQLLGQAVCTERRRGEHAASAYDGRMCVEGEACIYRKGNPCISGKYGTFYDL